MNTLSDVSTINYLIHSGFLNIGSISAIKSSGIPNLPELNSCGLYAITKPLAYQNDFLSIEETSKNKNVLAPWSIENLEKKWIDDTDILYYGVAGTKSARPLKKRINDLINHCCGRTTDRGPHKGGEIIWQLKNYDCFEIWVLPIEFSANPRQVEKNLLHTFFHQKGKLPFANRIF